MNIDTKIKAFFDKCLDKGLGSYKTLLLNYPIKVDLNQRGEMIITSSKSLMALIQRNSLMSLFNKEINYNLILIAYD